jgi:hypothetical protein
VNLYSDDSSSDVKYTIVFDVNFRSCSLLSMRSKEVEDKHHFYLFNISSLLITGVSAFVKQTQSIQKLKGEVNEYKF